MLESQMIHQSDIAKTAESSSHSCQPPLLQQSQIQLLSTLGEQCGLDLSREPRRQPPLFSPFLEKTVRPPFSFLEPSEESLNFSALAALLRTARPGVLEALAEKFSLGFLTQNSPYFLGKNRLETTGKAPNGSLSSLSSPLVSVLASFLFSTDPVAVPPSLTANQLLTLKAFLTEHVFATSLDTSAKKKKHLSKTIAEISKPSLAQSLGRLRSHLKKQPITKSRKALFPKIVKYIKKKKGGRYRKTLSFPSSRKEVEKLKSNPEFSQALEDEDFKEELRQEARKDFEKKLDRWLKETEERGNAPDFELGLIRPQIDQLKFYFE